MRVLQQIRILALAACIAGLPAVAAAATAPVVVFPLQELGARRNEVNLPFTVKLADRLAASGNEVSRIETVIAFMANNRIRTAGYLETFHLKKVWEELAAPLVLLGTVTQVKERPEPSVGLTLQLVRSSDARTVWSYVGSLSSGDERRPLGVGEPKSVAELWPLLLDDVVEHWPWEIISEVQQAYQVSIDSFVLSPQQLVPGAEVTAWVRLRNVWPAGRAPRIFFKADDQLHAATVSADGSVYQAAWVAGDKNGRFPVTLLLDWPIYGRRETALLGTYLVDGTLPLIEFELRGTRLQGDVPVFGDALIIIPKPVVRKPLDRWRVSFFDMEDGAMLAEETMLGNLPERIVWRGEAKGGEVAGDGTYKVVLEAWDKAGNTSRAEREVIRMRSQPDIGLAVAQSEGSMVVDLSSDSRVPLAYWRMEMWTKEGKFLAHAEGKELPAQIGVDLPDAAQGEEIQGIVVVRDALGNLTRQKVEDLLPKLQSKPDAEVKKEEPAGISEKWVDEF